MKKVTLFTVLIFFIGLGSLHGETLTLQDCIQKALHTHPDIKRFLLQVERSKKEVDAIQADYLPQLSFNAEYDPTRTYVFSTGVHSTQWTVMDGRSGQRSNKKYGIFRRPLLI